MLGINKGSWKNYLNFHFESLSYHYGKDKNYYDNIFNLNDLDDKVKPFLENIWGIYLPKVKMRDSKFIKKAYIKSIKQENIQQIINLYKCDYKNGWVINNDN